MIQHIGFVQIDLIPSGDLTMEELEQHWLRVNEPSSKEEFEAMINNAFELWDIRSQVSWRVFDQNGILLSEL